MNKEDYSFLKEVLKGWIESKESKPSSFFTAEYREKLAKGKELFKKLEKLEKLEAQEQ
jgi:hypothetical protein